MAVAEQCAAWTSLPGRRAFTAIIIWARRSSPEVFLLGKAVSELGYELNTRPGWVRILVEAILQQFQEGG